VLVEDVNSAIDELQWQEFSARRTAQSQAVAVVQPAPQIDHSSTGRFESPPPPARKGPELYVGPQDTGKQETLSEHPLAKLVVVAEGRTIGEMPLRMGRTIIGRTADNDLQIDSRFVSRHHCQIVTKSDGCVVEDLNSTNGIVVKAKRVRRHSLNDGDVITIGKHDLLYVDERSALRNGNTGGRPALPSDDGDEDPEHGKTQVV
jgi:general secretion pathway protein A